MKGRIALILALLAAPLSALDPAPAPAIALPPLHAAAFGETLALAIGGAWIALRLRIPAGAMLVPMLLCGGLAWLLARVAHVDPLTAYLATSPGGADTVTIIASASPVDVPFVMAMQSARFIVVAFCGPALARFVARHVPA